MTDASTCRSLGSAELATSVLGQDQGHHSGKTPLPPDLNEICTRCCTHPGSPNPLTLHIAKDLQGRRTGHAGSLRARETSQTYTLRRKQTVRRTGSPFPGLHGRGLSKMESILKVASQLRDKTRNSPRRGNGLLKLLMRRRGGWR